MQADIVVTLEVALAVAHHEDRLVATHPRCWDREQTRASLSPYLIEEAYEALEALEGGKRDAMMEELGDLLFQVVFHAQVARELGEFTMADLLERLADKMITRHPHVFGDANVETPQEALAQWETIKRRCYTVWLHATLAVVLIGYTAIFGLSSLVIRRLRSAPLVTE
ncbi:MAG: hypothetical protein HC782_02285 [Gammaproteobacteria bacterium]|nr:hypothetical protein [Gammaproteobacteria bacterium]